MKLSAVRSTLRQTKADAVVLFTEQDTKLFAERISPLKKLFGARFGHELELSGFNGKSGECFAWYTDKKISAPQLFLAGLGETASLSTEKYRRAAACAARHAQAFKVKHLAFRLPEKAGAFSYPEIARAASEGVILSLYAYDKYLTEKSAKKPKPAELIIAHEDETVVRDLKRTLNETRIICDATCLARDCENAPGNELHPETFARIAEESAERYGYSTTVWDKDKIESEGFGGLLAVNAGSTRPARFIILEHNADKPELETIVLVGKGITFDAGGISLKPSAGMAEMKMDMSGGAAVLGAMEAAARLKLPVHLVGLIPATENLPGGSAMRPGDVITHYGGKTSEVDNTDAEGRLVLADALGYAATFKPAAVIDLATLTGACVVALGQHATGMMGNDEALMAALKEAGEATYERVWQLPLFEEYEKQIRSDIADVKNVGGRWGGAITAGLFLKKFVGDLHWVHLDIAGTAILEEAKPYAPKGGSGVGVRLLIEFLTRRCRP
jgi:leucyl aminopeptidase